MMMSLSLGSDIFIFETATVLPSEISRSRAQKLSKHTRTGQRDKLQHLGPGDDVINMKGTIFPCSNLGTSESIDELDVLAQKGQAHRLIADGEIKGKWMISNIQESHAYFDNNAKARRIDFSCTLKRQGA